MHTRSAHEHTLLASAQLLRNYQQHQPSNQSDTDWKLGRVHSKGGIVSDLIYVIVISIYV
jgi:hypothetical protein